MIAAAGRYYHQTKTKPPVNRAVWSKYFSRTALSATPCAAMGTGWPGNLRRACVRGEAGGGAGAEGGTRESPCGRGGRGGGPTTGGRTAAHRRRAARPPP